MRRAAALCAALSLAGVCRAETSVAIRNLAMHSSVIPASFLDTFDAGEGPNLWGGGRAAFSSPSAVLAMAFDAGQAFGGAGRALSLSYDLPSAGDFAGVAFSLAPGGGAADLSGFDHLAFRVKGGASGQSFKIELKTADLDPARNRAAVWLSDYLDGGASGDWREVQIPLKAFANLDGLSDVREVVLVFERDAADLSGFPASGTVFLDDLRFGDGAPPLRVDHFGDNAGPNALGGNIAGDFTFDAATFHDAARSLRSVYDVSAPDSFQGLFFIFGGGADGWTARPVDLSPYGRLSLWLRGESPARTPARIRIELVDSGGTRSVLLPDDASSPLPLSTDWRPYDVPLSRFPGLDRSTVRQLNVVYENAQAVNASGAVYFDEVRFE